MSEQKKSGASSRGGKKRSRSKTERETKKVSEEVKEAAAVESAAEESLALASVEAEEPVEALSTPDSASPQIETAEETPAAFDDPAPEAAPRENEVKPVREPQPQVRWRPSEEYVWQFYFDRNQRQYVGTVAEFPEIKVTGSNRETVSLELENRLEDYLDERRQRGEPLPEPLIVRRYPERLDLRISQGLYRRLDLLSRFEKVSIDQLLGEIITGGIEKRLETPNRSQGRAGQPQPHSPQQQRQRHHQPEPGNRKHSHQQGRRLHGRAYQETLENRESFLEYVRNLEKGGGNRWKK